MKTLNLNSNYKTDYMDCYLNEYTEIEFNERFKGYDIIVTQPISDNYREKTYLSTKYIIENCNHCKIIILDSLYFDFYYFDLTYTFFQDKLLQTPIDYHYNYMMECYKNQQNIDYYIHNYVYNENLKTSDDLEKLANDSLKELKRRYDENMIKYVGHNIYFVYTGDYIRENYKHKLLFYSMNHPTKFLLQFVCQRITELLNLPNSIDYVIDQISNPKCILYKCIQKVVHFDVNSCELLTLENKNIHDVCSLYYSAYKNVNLI
jgi:hypothetical protein